jgi:phosphopantothenoylcysteine decarboxylase/phosphopantothenate--cysteine ligase
VLLGVTGGIAAYKSATLARLLTGAGAEVDVVLTDSAQRFVGADTFAALTGRPAYTSLWERPGEVLHVRLAHSAELAVVAPATANAIARLANGIADDLLTSVLLEAACPMLLAPAMHTGMWEHPATRGNVTTLEERGVRFVGPVEGPLAHGDEGPGRMSEPEEIFAASEAALEPQDLTGRRILVTAGPTHEPIDPVRFIGNRSSGKMGIAIAAAAAARGGAVTLVLGPGTAPPPPNVEVVRTRTAEDMRDAVLARSEQADAIVMAAAIADFRPKEVARAKLKKDQGPPEIVLEPTPDILRELAERSKDQILVGFAAETDDVEAQGRVKLRSKGLDLIVANLVGREGTGFGSDTNEAAILGSDGRDAPMRTWSKAELATAVCDRIAARLAETVGG